MLSPNFLAKNKGENWGKHIQLTFKFFGGHLINLEKGLSLWFLSWYVCQRMSMILWVINRFGVGPIWSLKIWPTLIQILEQKVKNFIPLPKCLKLFKLPQNETSPWIISLIPRKMILGCKVWIQFNFGPKFGCLKVMGWHFISSHQHPLTRKVPQLLSKL